jgi:hypothetical protein
MAACADGRQLAFINLVCQTGIPFGNLLEDDMHTKRPNFSASRADLALIGKIVSRGLELAERNDVRGLERTDSLMDMLACHNSCPLRLQDLLNADDFNFAHDFFGIRRHMDRTTGELTDFFVPRFAAPRMATAGA